MRCHTTVLRLFLLVCCLPALLPAQQMTKEQFRTEFNKSLEISNTKGMDTVLKRDRGALLAIAYAEELCLDLSRGKEEGRPRWEALLAAWARCFEKSSTLEKVQRWVDGARGPDYEALQRGRSTVSRLWEQYTTNTAATRDERLRMMQDMMGLARRAGELGHSAEAADVWSLASVIGSQVPDKTIDDRRETLRCLEEFLTAREAWEFTFDTHYLQNQAFVKAERERLAEADKAAEKRQKEGYGQNVKGIDALVVAGVAPVNLALDQDSLATWEELDYGPKNGPLPTLWWNLGLAREGSATKFEWFRRQTLYLLRTGANKFAVGTDPADAKKATEVDISSKGKASTFYLDPERKQPYSMFFWSGSDRERIGDAECNLTFTTESATIYFRSATSWKGTLGTEVLHFYDDNCSGTPCDTDLFEPPLRVATLGEHQGEGTQVPLLDSMRIGKGPRQPFSEFVKLAGGWFHLRRDKDHVVVRPLNPEYNKTGKVKLVWAGPKPSAPAQLVIRGSGDYVTACFDVAGGKEIEVPAGEYTVIFGRIVVGKGARVQNATLYRGDSKPFVVEAGKTTELKMGAPFAVRFSREGEDTVSIDALSVLLHEASGCVLTDLQGMTLAPEVLAAKAEDGKGAKVVGKFMPFTDPELVNQAVKSHRNLGLLCALYPLPDGYKDGPMVLQVKLPAPGYKLGLQIKKHVLFGAIAPVWK
jgi:hypothetical protein